MNHAKSFALLALIAAPRLAQAQLAQTPAAPAAPAEPATAAVPASLPAAVAVCELGENIGVDANDALVASRLICGEVVAKARAAGRIPPATYRVNFGKLGSRILLQVAEYGDGARLSDERHVQLLAIENVSAIASRVAESLVSKRAMGDLETTENVLPEEEMQRRQKQGRMHFEAGLLGISHVGGKDMAPSPGIQLGLTYELKRAYLTMAFRAGSGDGGGIADLGLGGGSYLSDGDIAPYVGGGVSWIMSHSMTTDSATSSNVTGSGFAPYVEAGVGLFRTSKTGLRAGLRVNVPTYQMKSSSYGGYQSTNVDGTTTSVWTDTSEKKYGIPVAASVTMSF